MPGGFYLDRAPQAKHLSMGGTAYSKCDVDQLWENLNMMLKQVRLNCDVYVRARQCCILCALGRVTEGRGEECGGTKETGKGEVHSA